MTAIALVIMAVLAIFTVSFGVANTAFERKGVVVLTPSEYRADRSSCPARATPRRSRTVRGSRSAAAAGFSATLGEGVLRSGRCLLPFTLSSLSATVDINYTVTVGDVPRRPSPATKLASSSGTLTVFLAG